jgi:Arc/MetJ-type ribon-helix-helix transcriptional regulator
LSTGSDDPGVIAVRIRPRLVVISVKLPEDMVMALEELVSIGKYKNRSHAIRAAIRLLLTKEYNS